MPNFEQKIVIIAVDQVSDTQKKILANTKKAFDEMTRQSNRTKNSIDGMSKSLISLKTIAVGLGGIITGKLVKSFVNAGTEVEDLTAQFEVLLGSTVNAKKRMEDLSKFAQTTPFQLTQVANASKVLQTLTSGALAAGEGLRLVGDTAAARGADFDNLALHVGRAYDGLRNNRPVGESMMRLQELGIVTGGVRAEIENLTKQGLGVKAWEVLENQLKENSGGMERMSRTVSGLGSTIKDQLAESMRQMLDSGIWDKLRDIMSKTVSKLNEALDKKIFQRWGQNILALSRHLDTMISVVKAFFIAFTVSKIIAIETAFKSLALTVRTSMIAISPVLAGLTAALVGLSITIDKIADKADKYADSLGGVNKLTKEHNKILSEHLPKVIELDKKYGDALTTNRHATKQLVNHKNAIDDIMGTGYTEDFLKKSTEEQERFARATSLLVQETKKQNDELEKSKKGKNGTTKTNLITTKEEFIPGTQKSTLLADRILQTERERQEKITSERIKFEDAQRDIIKAEKEKELALRYEIQEMMISAQQDGKDKELAMLELNLAKESDIWINEKAKNNEYLKVLEEKGRKERDAISEKYAKIEAQRNKQRILGDLNVVGNFLQAANILTSESKKFAALNKAIQLGQIVVNTARAVTQTLPNIPLSLSVGAIGAAQFAKAASAKFAAKGADYVTNGPELLVVGDNPGGRERVQVTPESSPNINGPQPMNVNFGNISINTQEDIFDQMENNPEALGRAFIRALKRGAMEGVS